jgi:hypothetical protein
MPKKNPVLFQTELEQMDLPGRHWDDLINLADEQVKQGSVLDISTSDWQQAMEDFRYKGLVQ